MRCVPPAPGNDAQRDFRQAEARARRGDPIVAGQRDFEAAAHHRAVHGCDHGNIQLLEPSEQPAIGLLLGRPGKLADVGAGKKGAALAGQHHGLNVLHLCQIVQRGVQIAAHDRIDGIDRRIVH